MIDLQPMSLMCNVLKQDDAVDAFYGASSQSYSDRIVGAQPVEDVSAAMPISVEDLDFTNFEARESSHPEATASNKVC